MRPGEKLYEEILIDEERTRSTKFEKIFIAPPTERSTGGRRGLKDIIDAAAAGDEDRIVRGLGWGSGSIGRSIDEGGIRGRRFAGGSRPADLSSSWPRPRPRRNMEGPGARRKMAERPGTRAVQIQPSLVISNAGVDSNMFYSPSNPIKDFTLTAGPAATIYFRSQEVRPVRLRLAAVRLVLQDRAGEDLELLSSGIGPAQPEERLLQRGGVYSDARERWNTEIDIRPRRKELGFGGSALVKLAWKTSFAMAYRTVKYNYESIDHGGFNLRERLNRQESYANLSLYYQVAEDRRFFIDFEYGRYQFRIRDRGGPEGRRERRCLRRARVLAARAPRPGPDSSGYKKFDPLRAGTPNSRGSSATRFSRSGWPSPSSVRGSYLRDVQFSIWYGDAYYIETRPGVGVSLYPLPLPAARLRLFEGTESISCGRRRRDRRDPARRL